MYFVKHVSNQKDPRLTLRVEVFAPGSSVPTSDTTLKPGELLAANLSYGKGEIAAVSGSELYFRHPDPESLGNDIEYANGYNPYWDVRLKALTKTERLGALLARAPSLFSNGGSVAPPPLVPDQALLETDNALQHDAPAGLPVYSESDTGASSDVFTSVVRDTTDFQFTASASAVSSSHFFQHALLEPGSIDTAQEFVDQNFGLSDTALANGFDSLSLMLEGTTLDDIQNTMVNEVETVIVDAVTELISGALSGVGSRFAGGSLATAYTGLSNFADGVRQNISYLDSALEAVVADMRLASAEIEAEVERIKETVARRYEEGLASLEETIAAEITSAQDQIDLLPQLLDPQTHGLDLDSLLDTLDLEAVDIDRSDIEQMLLDIGLLDELGIVSNLDTAGELLAGVELRVEQQISDLEMEQLRIDESRESRQAQLLIDVVNSETDLFDIDMETALRVVDLIRESEDPVDPLSVTEGEEAESEDGYVISNR